MLIRVPKPTYFPVSGALYVLEIEKRNNEIGDEDRLKEKR
jgi:hypothetical protein